MSDAIVEKLGAVPDNTLSYLRQQIRQIMNETSDHLSTGAGKDHSESSRSCGMLEGLALAERELLDVQERLERS